MKEGMRNFIVMALVIGMVLTSAACSDQSSSDDESSSTLTVDERVSDAAENEATGTWAEVETQTEEQIEAEIQTDTENETESQTLSVDNTTVATDAVMIAEADRNYAVISQEETVRIDGTVEFAIEYMLITKKVVPTIIPEDGSYSYILADEGEVFVDACMAYTNLSSSDVSVTEVIDAVLRCGWEDREFAGLYLETDERTRIGTGGTIASQETGYIHLVFDISDEYGTNGKALQMFLCIEGNNYMYMVNQPTDIGDLVTNGAVESYTEISGGQIEIGNLMKEDFYEAYIVYANISEEVYAAMPIGISYAKADEGEKFVDICICYKNTSQEEALVGTEFISSDGSMTGVLVSSDNTTYSGALVFENEDRDSLKFQVVTPSVSLEPNESVYMHLLFSVPEEVADSEESLQACFSFNGSEETYIFKYR